MERLEKVINILKLTPHRQPDLVKEAAYKIVSRPLRSDPQTQYFLKPMIEILILYCDDDDSAQRSIFNDLLNCILSTFQHQNYQLILLVLLDVVHKNGTIRSVTAALQRIPHLIRNVKPIELGCDHPRLLKSLIEVAKRSDDEPILKALDFTLAIIMPYLDTLVRENDEMKLLINNLVDILLHNLQNESSQTKRLAASSIATICSHNDAQNILNKIKQLGETNFIGFCLCVRAISQLAQQEYSSIIQLILREIESNFQESTLMATALETLRDMFNYEVKAAIIDQAADLIHQKFLTVQDTKVMLQANALACISSMIRLRPTLLDRFESTIQFKDHSDVALRNQSTIIIGNYIEASWRFPLCVDHPVECSKIKKLWVKLTSILNDDKAHPDTLKCCVVAIRTCLNTLLESDHCHHIVEYQDLNNLIQLYRKSNFKPFKIEVLGLFATLNFRNVHFLERNHWIKIRSKTASSLITNLQERILSIVISSLVDEHQRIRAVATSCLIEMIPNLYLTKMNDGQKNPFNRSCDSIVSLAHDLASEHLTVLKQPDDSISMLDQKDKSCMRCEDRCLSSSFLALQSNAQHAPKSTQIAVNTPTNLMHVVDLLKSSIDESIDQGKTAISSIVNALYEVSLVYPVYQYHASWDCRPSENCECYRLLNFLLTYLENLTEPDIVVEDLQAYNNFLALAQKLLYALCHESVLSEYQSQTMKPNLKLQANLQDGYWSELTLNHTCLETILEYHFTHLIKLLKLTSFIIEERKPTEIVIPTDESSSSNRLLLNKIHRKLESSYRSSKKSLNQQDERFCQVLETCLAGISNLLEFISMNKSIENVKDILGCLRIISPICPVSSLICARQLLKSLFGINILALYQPDVFDISKSEISTSNPTEENYDHSLNGVYHYLIANPYKTFSNLYTSNNSKIFNESSAISNYGTLRALTVKRKIEDRVKSLFEHNPNQLVLSKVRQLGEILKSTITEFTPIVMDSMTEFRSKGSVEYRNEFLLFMSLLKLLRVNIQKLALPDDLIKSIDTLLNISPEVFQPEKSTLETLLKAEKPNSEKGFEDWLSIVMNAIHILVTQTKEEVVLTGLHTRMSDESFVDHLMNVVQLCIAEILTRLYPTNMDTRNTSSLVQQLASYILYLTHMFQSGLFYQLSKSAEGLIKKEAKKEQAENNQLLRDVCSWARNPSNGFSLVACEKIFYAIRLIYPDLTIFWCNIMMLLNNVDCSGKFWRNLLVYKCQNCNHLSSDESLMDEHCLSLNIELTRRGVLCLVLDFVSITMNDNVEDVTWLVDNHINDIIRWSYETPITEFINAVHGNSASSGIFIQAVNSKFNSMTISSVTRLLWTLQQVHYTQYGALVVLLVEKLLSSEELKPYRSLTKNIEQFACKTVQKLLHETNKNLVVTNDEVLNQLLPEDIDHIKSLLDSELYPLLTKLLAELRDSDPCPVDATGIDSTDDEDSDNDGIDVLYFKAELIFWIAEHNSTANISSLLPALEAVKTYLSNADVVERVNKDKSLVCSLVSAIYSLALTTPQLPPPTRWRIPSFWSTTNKTAAPSLSFTFDKPSPLNKPPNMLRIDSKRPVIKSNLDNLLSIQKLGGDSPKEDMIEACRTACLKGLFLFENIDRLQNTFSPHFPELILCLARLPLLNSFILTPPDLWRQKPPLWPTTFDADDECKIQFPMVTHEVLAKDPAILDNFCERLLKLGWINRRQFEEAVMSLLGVLSNTEDLLISCKMISSITRLIRNNVGKKVEQSFESRVIELTKTIGSNLSSLAKRTQSILESPDINLGHSPYNSYLSLPAQRLRMMLDTVAIDDEVDVESCIRLLLNIYKLKLQQQQQLAPPLNTAICESMIALSDMFTDYEQFDWLFETFVQAFKSAERNEDQIQMQSLIIGLCKATSVCCYDIPNELTTAVTVNQRDVMFEKCRQSIDKCVKSEFGPLKLDALSGVYYMLEDSINIVSSGAWELDYFKQLRQSRLAWIFKLMPIILDRENSKLLTKKAEISKLIETLCETVIESESKVNLK